MRLVLASSGKLPRRSDCCWKKATIESGRTPLIEPAPDALTLPIGTDNRLLTLTTALHLLELAGSDIVDIAVNRDALWHERMFPDGAHVVDDGGASILEFQPVDLPPGR
jgi:hypothetical protein